MRRSHLVVVRAKQHITTMTFCKQLLLAFTAFQLTCNASAIKVLLPLVPEATSHQFQLLRLQQELTQRGHDVLVCKYSMYALHDSLKDLNALQ